MVELPYFSEHDPVMTTPRQITRDIIAGMCASMNGCIAFCADVHGFVCLCMFISVLYICAFVFCDGCMDACMIILS